MVGVRTKTLLSKKNSFHVFFTFLFPTFKNKTFSWGGGGEEGGGGGGGGGGCP